MYTDNKIILILILSIPIETFIYSPTHLNFKKNKTVPDEKNILMKK